MFNYPKNLYTDVRIETVMTTNIVIENDQLKANKSKREKGALIRIYDGRRWYYKASSEVEKLQEAIDELALMAEPNEQVMNTPIVKKLEVNKDTLMVFDGEAFLNTANDEKMALVKHCASLIDADEIKCGSPFIRIAALLRTSIQAKAVSFISTPNRMRCVCVM